MLILCTATVSAQQETDDKEVQKIESITKVRHPTEWYRQQSMLWEKEVLADTGNEENWRNWLAALHYAATVPEQSNDSTVLKERSRAMKMLAERLPDSPTRYIMEFYMKGANHPDSRKISNKVFETVRENLDRVEFYGNYIAYLLMEHPEEEKLIREICKRWHNSGDFSSSILNYFYNELSGLPAGSIIVGSGDLTIYSYLMLQHAKGLFNDIVPVCTPLLFVERYRNHLCEKLEIEPIGDDIVHDSEKMLLHILQKSKRPMFFSLTCRQPSFTDRLYSEGLASRYSETRYDNIAAKRRNFEENYLLDYLREDFSQCHPNHERIKINYVIVFKSLLDHYKKNGNKLQYNRLHALLKGIIENNKEVSEEEKRYYEQLLDK